MAPDRTKQCIIFRAILTVAGMATRSSESVSSSLILPKPKNANFPANRDSSFSSALNPDDLAENGRRCNGTRA
jgi:hypothetical protein